MSLSSVAILLAQLFTEATRLDGEIAVEIVDVAVVIGPPGVLQVVPFHIATCPTDGSVDGADPTCR